MADTVTLRNTSGEDMQVWSPSGPDGLGVAGGDTVIVPGVVLDETEDAFLIGPSGAELTRPVDPEDAERGREPNPDVRAWPRALWTRVTTHTDRKTKKTTAPPEGGATDTGGDGGDEESTDA